MAKVVSSLSRRWSYIWLCLSWLQLWLTCSLRYLLWMHLKTCCNSKMNSSKSVWGCWSIARTFLLKSQSKLLTLKILQLSFELSWLTTWWALSKALCSSIRLTEPLRSMRVARRMTSLWSTLLTHCQGWQGLLKVLFMQLNSSSRPLLKRIWRIWIKATLASSTQCSRLQKSTNTPWTTNTGTKSA